MNQRTGSHTERVPAPTRTRETSSPAVRLPAARPSGPTARVVGVTGEIDLATRDAFHRAVSQALETQPPGGAVVLDLAGLTFIDSSGLHVLIDASRTAARRHVGLRIAAASHQVARVLRVTAVDARIPVFETVEHAAAPGNPTR